MWYVTTRHDDVFEHDDERSVVVLFPCYFLYFGAVEFAGPGRKSYMTASLSWQLLWVVLSLVPSAKSCILEV